MQARFLFRLFGGAATVAASKMAAKELTSWDRRQQQSTKLPEPMPCSAPPTTPELRK